MNNQLAQFLNQQNIWMTGGNRNGKYSLSTNSALKDIFENRNLVWLSKDLSKPLGTCYDKNITFKSDSTQAHVWFPYLFQMIETDSFVSSFCLYFAFRDSASPGCWHYEISRASLRLRPSDKISKVCLCAKTSLQQQQPNASSQRWSSGSVAMEV